MAGASVVSSAGGCSRYINLQATHSLGCARVEMRTGLLCAMNWGVIVVLLIGAGECRGVVSPGSVQGAVLMM